MPSLINSMAARAKAHHDSVNAAYTTLYSPRNSSETLRNNSITSETSSTRNPTNMSKAWTSLKNAAKDHHESVNAAYGTYYAPGSQSSSTASSRSPSIASEKHEDDAEYKPTNFTKAWNKVKNVAVEHHRSVNSAYATYYGGAATLKN